MRSAGVGESSVAPSLAALQKALEGIYVQVNPSVVHIRVVQIQKERPSVRPEIPGFPFPFPPGPQEPGKFRREGSGSGFVWDKQGHIVSNNHVVGGADQITVTFHDGTTVPARIVGTDPDSDLAVIRVDLPAARLEPVQVADSTKVKVGQLAVAIGNPFGLQSTMTVGFISALGRLLPVGSEVQGPRYTIPDIIQTDAAINPGNSGGVLVNDTGQVIGVTTAIISPVGASVGIGFAVPTVIVKKVVPALITVGHYQHPWLGVSGRPLTPGVARAMGLKAEQRGALVVDVLPNSPADNAGLRGSDRQATIDGVPVRVGGDVIVAIDRRPVKGFDDVITFLARETNVGQTVTLNVLRRGRERDLQVTLDPRPGSETPGKVASVSGKAWVGVTVRTMIPEIAQAMNLPVDQKGVLVEQVVRDSPADKAGIRGSYKPILIQGRQLLVGGDIILAIDGQSVSQMKNFQAPLQGARPGQEVDLSILRDGKPMQVKVTLASRPTKPQ